jgi:hypothetical protein
LKDKWEDELKAAIESEYRRQRSDWLSLIQWWLRDVWLHTLGQSQEAELLTFPDLPQSRKVAERISAADAQGNLQILEQLQKLLNTNVQEALALEVSLLRLRI